MHFLGSILAVTVADKYAPNKKNRFVGICIERNNEGLWSNFTLRNVIDKTGKGDTTITLLLSSIITI